MNAAATLAAPGAPAQPTSVVSRLEAEGLRKSYGPRLVVKDVHLAVSAGEVVGLLETGPHCVLRVQPADPAAEETLIPFVDAYVDAVEQAERRIRVDWQADY